MTIYVRLLGEFRKHLDGKPEPLAVELCGGSIAADLAAALKVSTSGEIIVGINGQLGKLDSPLADGDEVIFVSPMSGG